MEFSGPGLVAFLNAQRASAAPGDVVFFRLRTEGYPFAPQYEPNKGYQMLLSETPGLERDPVLTLTTEP